MSALAEQLHGEVTLAEEGLASNIDWRKGAAAGDLGDQIKTNVLLERLREAAAEAERTLAREAADEAAAAKALQQRAACLHEAPAAQPLDWVEQARESVRDPRMASAFANMEGNLKEAQACVEQAAAINEEAFDNGVTQSFVEQAEIPGFWLAKSSDQRLESVKTFLSSSGVSLSGGIDGTDNKGIISSFVKDVAERRARNLAATGGVTELRQIEQERHEWAEYLTLRSWDGRGQAGNTALILAAANGHAACVEELLAYGADISLANDSGCTALHVAATRAIAELLLAKGADPAALDTHQRTPFMVARADHLVPGNSRAEVIHAFGKHQQITAKIAAAIHKARAGEPEPAGPTAEELAAAAAERATASYYQGLGALALGQVAEAAEAFQRSLEADASGECADEARERLEEVAAQMAASPRARQ